jgi:Flp pilus assembly protein TadG
MKRRCSERGVALVEAAVTIPLLLLVAVAIFEFGRAYQTWQVLTNAAREGARVAVLSGTSDEIVRARVREYMQGGQLPQSGAAQILVQRDATLPSGAGGNSASRITVNYPFEFIVLQPVARLVSPGTGTGAPLTMQAAALMRNESP